MKKIEKCDNYDCKNKAKYRSSVGYVFCEECKKREIEAGTYNNKEFKLIK